MNVRLRIVLGLWWSAVCFGAEQAIQKEVFLFDLHSVLFDTDIKAAVWPGILSLPGFFKKVAVQVYNGNVRGYECRAAFSAASACQIPRAQTWAAIRQLAEKRPGCLYIFSNVAPQELAIHKEKYPEFFALFSAVFHPNAENNWTAKTDPVMCQQVQETIARDHGNARVTLFDDKAANQACAERNKWQFVHVKSDKQLADALHNESF